MKYTVILFYKYVDINNPEKLKEDQLSLANKLNMKGRMIIAQEGINGTFEGEREKIQEYLRVTKEDVRFSDIDFKESPGTGKSFPKLSVKVRDEIVTSKLGERVDPRKETANRIDPDTLHQWFEEGKDFQVIDMRNSYEFISGHFENSIDPEMKVFKDLPEKIESMKELKEKPVVTVCTGGVRCEKASAFLKNSGFKNVFQLNGGIHRYIEKYPDGHFKGSLYVFDGRVTMNTAPKDKREVVGKCFFCSDPTEFYADDDSVRPSRQILCCESCLSKNNHLRPASPVELKEVAKS
ncbi:MAG: rhodanese-related sulfurtransferase [Candidatus Paceibacterota bacterium]